MLDFDFSESFHHWRKFIIILHKQSHFESLFILFFFSILFLYFPSMNNAVMKTGELSKSLLKTFGQLLQSYYESTQGRIMGEYGHQTLTDAALLSPDCLRF